MPLTLLTSPVWNLNYQRAQAGCMFVLNLNALKLISFVQTNIELICPHFKSLHKTIYWFNFSFSLSFLVFQTNKNTKSCWFMSTATMQHTHLHFHFLFSLSLFFLFFFLLRFLFLLLTLVIIHSSLYSSSFQSPNSCFCIFHKSHWRSWFRGDFLWFLTYMYFISMICTVFTVFSIQIFQHQACK